MAHVACIWGLPPAWSPRCQIRKILLLSVVLDSRLSSGDGSDPFNHCIRDCCQQIPSFDLGQYSCEVGDGHYGPGVASSCRSSPQTTQGDEAESSLFSVHWLIGTTAIILAWYNIFKGFDVYVGSWPSGGERKALYVLFGINVAILAFIYLLLDRLPYIRAQSKDPDSVFRNVGSDEGNGYTRKTVNGQAPV